MRDYEGTSLTDSSVAIITSSGAASIDTAHQLRGIVVSKMRDGALGSAAVYLGSVSQRRPRPPATADALTDSIGRFTISAPDTGDYELVVRLIGYRTLRRPVRFGVDSGLAAIVRMAVNDVQLCPLIITYPHSVAVRVIDAITGDSITAGASLEISSGLYRAYANSEDRAAQEGRDASLLVAGDELGAFEVIVRHPRYRTWHAHNIAPETGACGMNPAYLIARMYPKRLPYPPL